MGIEVTAAELRAAILSAVEAQHADADGAMTAVEWGREWGVCHQVSRRRIAQALAAGLMSRATVRRQRIDGVVVATPAYRPTLGDLADA